MKKLAGVCLAFVFACTGFAQDASDKQLRSTDTSTTVEKTALDLFHLDGSYVWGSDIKTRDNYGEQDAIQSEFEYAHRFHLSGNLYLRTGVSYYRFDFGQTLAPLPLHLQSLSLPISVEYMVGNDVGAFFSIQPGFFFENDIGISSFDIPITAGRVFVLQKDKLFFFIGATSAFLRTDYPVLPLAGIVWRPNKQWTLNFVPPDPRIIYSPNDKWAFYGGGQITGWSFRTDRHDGNFPQKLNGAAVDYTEYRGGAGFSYSPTDQISFDVTGGWVFERNFNFGRAEKKYSADGAPYVRLSMKAEF